MAYFKDFALEHNLTVDYGYTYGFYRGFYISIQENFGSSKTLTIISDICKNVDLLKSVLDVYGESLIKYCVVDMERNDEYLKFSFNLPTEKSSYVIEFLDRFIDSYNEKCNEHMTYCHICHEKIIEGDNLSTIDYHGIIMPVHADCLVKNSSNIKEEVKKKENELNAGRNGYFVGFLGAFGFSLIYIAILCLGFIFMQFILSNYSEGNIGLSSTVIQYIPSLIAFAASPLINVGYELVKGKKGTGKFFIIASLMLISTIAGIFIGFALSLAIYQGYNLLDTIKLVFTVFLPNAGAVAFRKSFIVYFISSILFGALSLLFTFNSKKAKEETNSMTYEKLD